MGDKKLRQEDLLSTAEAVAYVNARLAEMGEPGVSAVTFRTHIHVPRYAQLEPIRLGEREMEDGTRRGVLFVFTPRLLDAYIANRARNRRRGEERLVARPTAEEAAQVFDTPTAVEYVNRRIAERGGAYTLKPAMLWYYRDAGKLPQRPAGSVQGVYLRDDLDAFADFLLAERDWSTTKTGRRPVAEAAPG